jgi:hypothetical protein
MFINLTSRRPLTDPSCRRESPSERNPGPSSADWTRFA